MINSIVHEHYVLLFCLIAPYLKDHLIEFANDQKIFLLVTLLWLVVYYCNNFSNTFTKPLKYAFG